MEMDFAGPKAYFAAYLELIQYLLRAGLALAGLDKPGMDGAAAEAQLRLNRAAKRGDVLRGPVYDMKNHVVRIFYQKGYCVRAVKAVQELACWHTRRYNEGWDAECPKCDNTGIYARHELYHFTFKVGEKVYNWHQPDRLVTWPVETQGEPVMYAVKPVVVALDGYDARFDQALLWLYLRLNGVKAEDLPPLHTLGKLVRYFWWQLGFNVRNEIQRRKWRREMWRSKRNAPVEAAGAALDDADVPF